MLKLQQRDAFGKRLLFTSRVTLEKSGNPKASFMRLFLFSETRVVNIRSCWGKRSSAFWDKSHGESPSGTCWPLESSCSLTQSHTETLSSFCFFPPVCVCFIFFPRCWSDSPHAGLGCRLKPPLCIAALWGCLKELFALKLKFAVDLLACFFQ